MKNDQDGKVRSANLRFSQSFSQKGKLLKIAKVTGWASDLAKRWPSFRKALQEYKKANETLWILNKEVVHERDHQNLLLFLLLSLFSSP